MVKYKQGTRIKFNVQSITGTGKVVGVATIDRPIFGPLYIIEPDEPINSDIYQYTHICASEIELEEIITN